MKGKKKMLKRFVVKNYKNFRDEIVFDFGNIAGYQFNQDCLYGNLISKAIIYGRNATGKSNLGNAVLDIAILRKTMLLSLIHSCLTVKK